MSGIGKMNTVLASEAARQRSRQQEVEMEQQQLFSSLFFSEKLRALAETDGKKKTSPKSPMAFVNPAFSAASPFSFFPTQSRRATEGSAIPSARFKSNPKPPPYRRNVSLDALDSVDPLKEDNCADIEACQSKPKEQTKRVYVTRPPRPRRFSADEMPCVTIFSSEAPAQPLRSPPPAPQAPLAPRLPSSAVKLRERKGNDVVDGRHRVLSFPCLNAYEAFEDDLKYWRSVLHNSPQLRALEKR